ncbi:MAG TPA: HDIG domain-containing protein [Longimicrobiales bacterium]|nr:HDIG domain-containing protein [Longimicrobiales bacterium]
MNVREFFRSLSREPEGRWPIFLHHGARVAVLVAMALVVTVLFPVSPLPDFPFLERGMVAEEDVIAEIAFPVYRPEAELARARQDAAASVDPIFVYDSTAVDSMTADVDRFFARVDSAAEASGPGAASAAIREVLGTYGIPPSGEDVEMLADAGQRRRLRQTVRTVIQEELPRGIAVPGELEDVESRQIQVRGMGTDGAVSPDSVLTSRDFFERSRYHLPSIRQPGYEQFQRLLLVRFMVPSLRPDWTATEQARARARAAVSLTKGEVLRGERIIAAGDRVTEEQIERLRAYQQELERRGELDVGQRGLRTAGAFFFNLLILGILGGLLYFYRPAVYGDLRHVALLAFLGLSVVGVAAVVAANEASVALIPIAFPALVAAMLWDGRLAINLSMVLAVLLAGQPQFVGTTAVLTLVAGGAVAALSVRVVRRRAEIWVFILLIAGSYVATSLILGVLRTWSVADVVQASGMGTLNAVASAFAAMGFLPLFESFTRITTDQTLLELADINRPLLRRLSMEAPGTYAHSINVANLAEAAANAIGADALLTRVGVYYHDIGKVMRPELFIENQHGGRNPHDKLKPATSAAHIRDHIMEGLRLAEEHRLPESVKAFIAEHHGTQSISFFFDQAREAEPDRDLDPRDFTYPGPRPQSPETAIVMLADSVESAARVLPDPNPEAIQDLVERIVRGKMDAGQLDETPLTLRDLTRIREQFAAVLSGMYHHRIDYPPSREDREREPLSSGAGVG